MALSRNNTLLAGLICIVYLLIGPGLILLNQHILKALNFPYPMFLSGLGVLASGVLAQLVVKLGFVKLERQESVQGLLWYKRVLPVGLAHASTLAFGNAVYLYLNVGFIQMLKSFTPVIIMLTGYLANIETPTLPIIYSVVVISLGTAGTCSFNADFNVIGIAIMFAAELAEAIRLIFTQYFLQQLKFGVVEGQYVLSPASAFWLFLASYIFEYSKMIETNAFSTVQNYYMVFAVASVMGIGVNFLSYLVIQYTSSLTMKILGTARNILTIIIGVVFYKETVTMNEAIGYGVALLGFAGYNVAKSGYFDTYRMKGAEKKDMSQHGIDVESKGLLSDSSPKRDVSTTTTSTSASVSSSRSRGVSSGVMSHAAEDASNKGSNMGAEASSSSMSIGKVAYQQWLDSEQKLERMRQQATHSHKF